MLLAGSGALHGFGVKYEKLKRTEFSVISLILPINAHGCFGSAVLQGGPGNTIAQYFSVEFFIQN